MTIHVRIDNMKDAERLSVICRSFPQEMYLRSDKLCTDPKSTLGILAMMYSARDDIYMDTGDMGEEDLSRFMKEIADYIPEDPEEE